MSYRNNILKVFVYGFPLNTTNSEIVDFLKKKLNKLNISLPIKQIEFDRNLVLTCSIQLPFVASIASLIKHFKYTEYKGYPIHFAQHYQFDIKKVIFIEDVLPNSYKEIDRALSEDFDIAFVQSIIKTEEGKYKATVFMKSPEEAERCIMLLTEINGRPVTARAATYEEYINDQQTLGTMYYRLENASLPSIDYDAIKESKCEIESIMKYSRAISLTSYENINNFHIEKPNFLPDSFFSFLSFYTPNI